MNDAISLPVTVKELHEMVSVLQSRLKNTELELAYEQEKYQNLLRRVFWTKSEKLSREETNQLRLFNEAEYASEQKPTSDVRRVAVKVHKKQTGGGRKPLPPELERKRIVHELSSDGRACVCCGKERPVIGEQATEELETIPQQFIVHVHVRKKYGPCDCEEFETRELEPIVTAPMPKRLIPGGQFSATCIAFFITAKFVDSIPFYRMEKVLARHGIHIPRITLCGNAISAAAACQPLIDEMWEDTLKSPVIQMDETTVQVLNEPNRDNEVLHVGNGWNR